MIREEQRLILNAIKQYNSIPPEVVKDNLRRLFEDYTAPHIAKFLNVSVHTVYSWMKKDKGNRPNFETALLICEEFCVNFDELIK
jgi:DNA invertase Pin-like site-specific DNA recombinase